MIGLINGWQLLTGTFLVLSLSTFNMVFAGEIASASIQFKTTAWGPYAEIVIEYMPPMEEAMAAFNDPEARARIIAKAREEAEKNPAVLIYIPELDYGMTGTFKSLRIESGNGVSITPKGRLGTPYSPNRDQYTGTVEIQKFTKDELIGHYVANLYHKKWTDSDRPVTQREHIGHRSGEFRVDRLSRDDLRIDPEPVKVDPDADPLLRRVQEMGVPPEAQAMALKLLRDLPPEQQEMVLKSYKKPN